MVFVDALDVILCIVVSVIQFVILAWILRRGFRKLFLLPGKLSKNLPFIEPSTDDLYDIQIDFDRDFSYHSVALSETAADVCKQIDLFATEICIAIKIVIE